MTLEKPSYAKDADGIVHLIQPSVLSSEDTLCGIPWECTEFAEKIMWNEAVGINVVWIDIGEKGMITCPECKEAISVIRQANIGK